jgi:hypothetical protein
MKDTFRRVSLMIVTLIAAGLTYAHGFWAGHFLDLRPTDEYCTEKPLSSYPAVTWEFFPLHNLCHWSDETSTDLVPWYVNPVMFVFLAAAVFSFALAIQAVLHNRSAGLPPACPTSGALSTPGLLVLRGRMNLRGNKKSERRRK